MSDATMQPVLVSGDLWAQIIWKARASRDASLVALLDQAIAGAQVCSCFEAGRNPMCQIHGSTAGRLS